MSCKRFRADAINEVINRETNLHFMNSCARKIDLKMYLRYLNNKDEHDNVKIATGYRFDSRVETNVYAETLSCSTLWKI